METRRTARIAGTVVGLAAAGLALTPSLVPRPAMFQGFLAGLCFGLGYLAAGAAARFTARLVQARHGAGANGRRRPAASQHPRTVPLWAWLTAAAVLAGYAVMLAWAVLSWQNDVRAKVDMPAADGLDITTFLGIAVVVALAVHFAAKGLRSVGHKGRRLAAKRTRNKGIIMESGAVAAVLAAGLAVAVLVVGALFGVDRIYSARNSETPPGITEPVSAVRSAGPESAVKWDKLGMQGRAFVGGGPNAEAIAAATGAPAQDPVRVYVGLGQGDTLARRAALAVQELKRTGGFARGTLVVATPTGSGWLERQAMDSVEYLHGGNTAIVSMQYSYQPSWVSFLFHQELPRDAGRALFDAVHTEWLTLPVASRPKLMVYGLSLGASGMQAAFPTVNAMLDDVDGAVFAGAPNNSQPWGTLQAERDPGSPVWQPVYQLGKNVRWLSNPGDFGKVDGPWGSSKVAYLQHATDAVTWLTPRLIWSKPQWLAGPSASGGRAPDVSDSMVWMPLVTYIQLAFDMFMGESVPAGHGHNFGDVAVDAWNNVAPGGLDQAAVDRISTIIASYSDDDSSSL